jgi:hypothetical protein
MSSTPRVAQKTDPSFQFGAVAGRTRSGSECAVKVRRVEHLRYGTLLMPDPGALPAWLTKAVFDRYARELERTVQTQPLVTQRTRGVGTGGSDAAVRPDRGGAGMPEVEVSTGMIGPTNLGYIHLPTGVCGRRAGS